ncbi:MAG: excalibur calcium-binding domain-containing protein [Pseudomonadota bacterium]
MKYPSPWRLQQIGYDPDDKAKALKARFASVSNAALPAKRSNHRTKILLKTVLVGLALFAITVGLFSLSPWPPLATVKHIASIQNCDAAKAFGVAPARVGEPGYWSRHDADNDGIACEPYYGR